MSNRGPKLAKPKERRRKTEPRLTFRVIVSSVFAAVLAGSTLLGGYVVLLPRVTASVSDPADSDDPFESDLTVTNTGYITLRAVEVAIAPISVGGSYDQLLSDPAQLYFTPWGKHNLGLDDKFVVNLADAIKFVGHATDANVEIDVRYELPLVRWRLVKRFPMRVRMQTNGKYTWEYREPPN